MFYSLLAAMRAVNLSWVCKRSMTLWPWWPVNQWNWHVMFGWRRRWNIPTSHQRDKYSNHSKPHPPLSRVVVWALHTMQWKHLQIAILLAGNFKNIGFNLTKHCNGNTATCLVVAHSCSAPTPVCLAHLVALLWLVHPTNSLIGCVGYGEKW